MLQSNNMPAEGTAVFCVLNAKYVHASPAPWCLAAGVKAYAPELYSRVRIIEANINQPPDEVLTRIINTAPAVVGFSCYIWNIEVTLKLCSELKRVLPGVIVVLGGPEVSYRVKDILLNNTQIDYILAGEGEKSAAEFLEAVFYNDSNDLLPECAQAIAGLCWRYKDGTIYENEPCVLSGPVPSPIEAGYAAAVEGRIAYFETSRGCPYSCAFCLSGRCGAPRYFPSDAIWRDLLLLANSGARTIKFVDRTFNANAVHANKILQFILENYGEEIPIRACFHFEIAGDILKEETFALLDHIPIGAVQLEIGMQSFHEPTLKAVRRKTDTAVLQANIRRLIAMGNMHIHIDLIAGLPQEDLPIFAESFNKAYALKAHMLQLGFLKLLHGSAMRDEPQEYPCSFDEKPPYEVQSTPWLSERDFDLLRYTENALDRVYNSGRFSLTLDYVLGVSGKTPFEFFKEFGVAAHEAGVASRASLDDFTAVFSRYCAAIDNVDSEMLRDALVRDRLATNSTGYLSPCLYRQDDNMARALRWLSDNPATAPKKGVRRGAALLYAANTVCWVDYDADKRNPVTRRWQLNEMPLDIILR
ncbi:MAG: DUF4080 domain-containing protein [Christensenellales bacterium]